MAESGWVGAYTRLRRSEAIASVPATAAPPLPVSWNWPGQASLSGWSNCQASLGLTGTPAAPSAMLRRLTVGTAVSTAAPVVKLTEPLGAALPARSRTPPLL